MPSPKTKFGSLVFAGVCLLVLGGVAAFAQRQFMIAAAGRPEVKVSLAGTIEREHVAVPVEKAQLVKEGETLSWTLQSQNDGTAPALDYKTVSRIPAGTTFVPGSARAEGAAKVVYSIDGGKTYAASPMVDERQADGSVKKVAAPVSMYTNLRYEWSDPLAPGGHVSASYKVIVN